MIPPDVSVWSRKAEGCSCLDAIDAPRRMAIGNMAGRATETVRRPTAKRPNGHPQLGDGDPVLTQYAMTRAARRYQRDGRTIRIAFAPAGLDFNDVLKAEVSA